MEVLNLGVESPAGVEEVEVTERAKRRRFTAEEKLRILKEADACRRPGELGALLRREGLYSASISRWRKKRAAGELRALAQKRRGPVPRERNPLEAKVAAQEKEIKRLRARAERAEALVELQKKVSEILGVELKHNEKD
jgi:transposase-like protein